MNVPEEYSQIIYRLDDQFNQIHKSKRFFKSQRMDNFTFLSANISKFTNSTESSNLPSEVETARYLSISYLFYLHSFYQLNKDLYPNKKIQNLNIILNFRTIFSYYL
ncbi:unnamed protein product [Paramecium primaurelia]|uniref:Uncharacterized protein n=1 Tax=Paramecium primaurelia TaxID=5886 RepID=A0A8S1NB38_PARPR|nr:unnamed protein product [Paramecium primaurelia]